MIKYLYTKRELFNMRSTNQSYIEIDLEESYLDMYVEVSLQEYQTNLLLNVIIVENRFN